MTDKPTPKDIDLLVRTYLGDCGPQANRVYPFVTAVLAKWGQPAGAADSQPAPVLDYPPLPQVGAIGYASVVDIQSYAKTLTIGPHLPGVRDIALWTTDQMRAYADETYALRIGAKHA